MEKLQMVLEAAFLIPCSIRDGKKKSIPLWYLLLGCAGSVLLQLMSALRGRADPEELFLSLLPGVFLILLAFLTREKIGYGDGIFLLILGAMVSDGGTMLLLLFLSLVLTAGYAAVLLARKKAGRNTKIPYLPFVLAAAVVLQLGEEFLA